MLFSIAIKSTSGMWLKGQSFCFLTMMDFGSYLLVRLQTLQCFFFTKSSSRDNGDIKTAVIRSGHVNDPGGDIGCNVLLGVIRKLHFTDIKWRSSLCSPL